VNGPLLLYLIELIRANWPPNAGRTVRFRAVDARTRRAHGANACP
jgi:hypothetical protein